MWSVLLQLDFVCISIGINLTLQRIRERLEILDDEFEFLSIHLFMVRCSYDNTKKEGCKPLIFRLSSFVCLWILDQPTWHNVHHDRSKIQRLLLDRVFLDRILEGHIEI